MDNTQAAYEFAAVQIENVATLIRKIASHQAEKASESAASGPELDEPDGDRDYQEMKGAFEFACDKLGWDYGDGYAEYLDSKKNKPADEPPQRADGVPEWFGRVAACLYNSGWQTGRGVNSIDDDVATRQAWVDTQAEIARRVAEDRRDALCHCQKKLKEARDERDAALAEVDMLKVRCDLAEHSREKFRARIAKLEARVAEQCSEIERLTRPVEDKPTLDGEHIFHGGTHWINHDSAVRLVQRERNARESAEASLEELREFCKAWYVDPIGLGGPLAVGLRFSDSQLDEQIAAYRKYKEPAK